MCVHYCLLVAVTLSKSIIWFENEAQSVPVSLPGGLFLFWSRFFGLRKDPCEKLENRKLENVSS